MFDCFTAGAAGSKYIPKKKHVMSVKKGWRAGHGSRLAYNINMMVSAGSVVAFCGFCPHFVSELQLS